jgi:hypothetical protein
MSFVVEFVIIGGGLPCFLGAFCSGSVFSAPIAFVSKSVLRSAKKLLVDTAFGGSLTAADVVTGLFDFLAIYSLLLDICLLRVFISWKSSSWAVHSNDVLLSTALCPASLNFRTAFSSFSVTMYMP